MKPLRRADPDFTLLAVATAAHLTGIDGDTLTTLQELTRIFPNGTREEALRRPREWLLNPLLSGENDAS